MNKVRIGFFSFTEITDPTKHRAYNEWHQLDHMPEQFPIRGVAYGQRWVSTPACRDARAVDEGLIGPVHYMTLYLMTDPVDETLDQFMDLGQGLRSLGRFPDYRASHLSGPFQFLEAASAQRVLISPEAVPYRPNRGIYVIVEEPTTPGRLDEWVQRLHVEHIPSVLEVDGVVGVWDFASMPRFASRFGTGNRRITMCYLDADPLAVAKAIGPELEDRWHDAPVRPVFAGPFETVIPYQWDWFEGS